MASKKLELRPSDLVDSVCMFRFNVRVMKRMDSRSDDFAHKREFGSLVHAVEAAYDLGDDPKKALEREVRKLKNQMWYNVKYSRALEQLKQECWKLFKGGSFQDGKGKLTQVESYKAWSDREFHNSHVLAVEKRLHVDVGPCILAPKIDLALSTEWKGFGTSEQFWVVERKTTEKWDDGNWQTRWIHNGQTTVQLLACNEKFKKEFGVAVEPIQVKRQMRKNVPNPQPIGKAERLRLKWVRKPQRILDEFIWWLEDFVQRVEQARDRNMWTKDGFAADACTFCSLKRYCRGEEGDRDLYVRNMNY